ncbi:archaemetzincin-2-like [Asterias amurensis]|uniref:archaemetzincin-2-like n=1 Tax=Asterias amurensis TaxID=7602 RepID=UPI003AB4B772
MSLSLLCSNTPEGRRRKDIRYLVYDLSKFDEPTQKLFRLAADCLSNSTSSTSDNEDDGGCEETGSRGKLFQHKSPVPKMGRQTYKMWKASLELSMGLFSRADLLDKPKTLHFWPLENFPDAVTSNFRVPGFDLIKFLVHFLQTYFPGLDVRLENLHDINSDDSNLVSRYHKKTKKKQFLVSDLYSQLHSLTGTLKRDFILGWTWTDLYPTEELNFVLGEASFVHRCAVLSFGRYEPLSYKVNEDLETVQGVDDDVEEDEASSVRVDGDLLWKLLRVATHETSHLFGLNHCVFFECSMNESKSISQALSQPFFLCPICLRKLQRFLKFDVKERYKGLFEVCRTLQEFYPSPGMERTCQWLERCMTFLNTETDH